MSDNFQDNVSFRSSTLGVAGDAIAVGTAAGAKSIIFNNSDSAGHLVWQPNANVTLSLPAAGGTVAVVGGIPGGFAAGTQTATSGTVVLSNSNGVSFGMSNSSIVTASFSQTNQTIGYFATGNTTQNSSTTLDARSITFNASGALSAGFSNGSIQLSAPGTSSLSATGGVSISVNANTISIGAAFNVSAGTTSNNLASIVFSNSNGISFGLNGSTLTGSVSVSQTNQTLGFFATGNTTQNSSTTLDARSLTFNGLGGLSAGYSNGSVQLSAPGTSSISATGGASVFVNGGTISIGAAFNVSAGTTSNNLTAVTWSNANGVSFGLNGSTITASVSQTNQTLGKYAIGNTVGESSSSTFDARTMSISGAGIASVGYSGNALVINVPAGGASIQVSAGTTSNGINNLVFSNSNGFAFGLNGSTITADILVRPEIFEPFPLYTSSSAGYLPVVGSLYIQPFMADYSIGSGRLNIIKSFSNSSAGILAVSNSVSCVSNTTGSRSVSYSYVKSAILYSRGTGTNNTRLESIWSNTWSLGIAQSVSVSTFGATSIAFTNAATVSYIDVVGSDGAYTTASVSASYSTSSAAASISTLAGSAGFSSLFNILSGGIIMPIGFNTNLSVGNYWLAQVFNISSTTAGTTAAVWNLVHQSAAFSFPSQTAVRVFGQTSTASNSMFKPGQGAYSATTSAIPANIAFNQVRSFATAVAQYFNIVSSNA